MMRRHQLALVAGILAMSTAVIVRASDSSDSPVGAQATSLDGIYSNVQADAAKGQFEKLCAGCHAFTVAAKKQPADLPLGDEPFLRKWEGKAIDELVTVIGLTMPNDGSAVVSEDEALALTAYILKQNGMPSGKNALTRASAAATLARPKS